MNRLVKGVVVGTFQVALVASLGAKLLYDRSTRPRVWAQAAPYDPSMPIRGRYVRLQLTVDLRGNAPGAPERSSPVAVNLLGDGDRLVAQVDEQQSRYDPSALHVRTFQRSGETLAVLDQPVVFFIPEHVPDPSRRAAGEQLWVEVTIPKKGPPRPIRLGVKKDGGEIEPLALD